MTSAPLGDLVTIVGGGTPIRNRPEFYKGRIPWITVKDFTDDFYIRTSKERISEIGLENSASRLIPAGNVILVTRMAVGKAAKNLIDVAINQDLKALLCGPKIDASYLVFFLAFRASYLEAQAAGATVKGITIDDIQDLEVPLPALPEQHWIAGLLEQADRLRRTRRYALELSNTFLPAAFLEFFGDPASNPRGFPRVQVEELLATDREGTKCGPFGSALKKYEYVSTGIPVWTMDNVSENDFQEEGCLYITDQKYRELAAYSVQNGDILISRAGTVGRMAVVRTKYKHSVIHTNLIRLSLNPDRILPIFFVTLMTWFGQRVARLKRGQENAYTFMSTGSLGQLWIPLPPMHLQERFALLVSRHEQSRAGQRESLRQARHLFQLLLHQAFGGCH